MGELLSEWLEENLRDNTVTGLTLIPDPDEQVDLSCDGVDLNRNYQFEWEPLGSHRPPIPRGLLLIRTQQRCQGNGPVNYEDNDGDGLINEDHVDGNDDDADGQIDEDWLGGNQSLKPNSYKT